MMDLVMGVGILLEGLYPKDRVENCKMSVM
jgi:hypothetical protein